MITWSLLLSVFLGVPCVYYLYLRRMASKPWNVKIDEDFAPPVTVIVPMHNEEKTIQFKLENLCNVIYPREKLQVILANDASTDQTMEKIRDFISRHPEFSIVIVDCSERRGKAKTLNFALKNARNDVVIMSDADSFWAPDILVKALPYLADPSVGGIVGRPKSLNEEQTSVTKFEKAYLDLVSEVLRYGESKIHSTIFFHGAFAAYKKEFLKEFNVHVDDSGTALDIVQQGGRTLFVPDSFCFVVSPITWTGRLVTKLRRAIHLTYVCGRCLKLLLKGRLSLPKRIALPEIFLYLFSPLIFTALAVATLALIVDYFPHSVFFVFLPALALIVPRTRWLLLEVLQNNSILFWALLQTVLGKKLMFWETRKETRVSLTREMLEREGLILPYLK